MKRSEMIKKIKDYIKSEDIHGKFINNQESSDLLTMIEEAGMLPPTITVLPDHYNRDNGSYGFEANEWEEE